MRKKLNILWENREPMALKTTMNEKLRWFKLPFVFYSKIAVNLEDYWKKHTISFGKYN